MIGRIRENFLYKVFALLCAIVLRWYVTNQTNPQQPRTITAAVAARGVPDGYTAVDKALTVSVTLEGPSDQINRIPAESVVAQVDLSHAHAGPNVVPVTVPLTGHDGVSVADWQPRKLVVTVEPQRTRRVDITVAAVGEPSPGYAAAAPVASPPTVTVAGLADSVESVAAVVVHPRIQDAMAAVDEDDPVAAVDDHGRDVPDVVVTPQVVHVRVPVVEAARERQAFVSPTIVGAVAPGYAIRSVTVAPDQVTLHGSAQALAKATGVVTEPVDISGAMRDVVRPVDCVAPPGLAAAAHGHVTVTVKVAPIAAAAAGPGVSAAPAGTRPAP